MAVIAGFVVAVAATPIAARVARRLGIVDEPGLLKVQTDPVPYLGGVAVFVALAIPVALGTPGVAGSAGTRARARARRMIATRLRRRRG